MTREEAEERILEKAKEIREIMKEYSPEWSGYITLSFTRVDCEEAISFNNEHWEEDRNYPIDAIYRMEIKEEWVKK